MQDVKHIVEPAVLSQLFALSLDITRRYFSALRVPFFAVRAMCKIYSAVTFYLKSVTGTNSIVLLRTSGTLLFGLRMKQGLIWSPYTHGKLGEAGRIRTCISVVHRPVVYREHKQVISGALHRHRRDFYATAS